MSSPLGGDFFRFSIQVRNPETGEWESPDIGDAKAREIDAFVKERLAEIHLPDELKLEEGTVITGSQIIRSDEDLLNRLKAEPVRGEAKKNLGALVQQLADKALGKPGDIRIEVRQVSHEERIQEEAQARIEIIRAYKPLRGQLQEYTKAYEHFAAGRIDEGLEAYAKAAKNLRQKVFELKDTGPLFKMLEGDQTFFKELQLQQGLDIANEEIRLFRFQRNLLDRQQAWENTAEQLEQMAAKYVSPEFRAHMHESGVSDLKLAELFGAFPELAQVVKAFKQRFDAVVKTARRGENASALGELARVYQELSPQLAAKLSRLYPQMGAIQEHSDALWEKEINTTALLGIVRLTPKIDLEGFRDTYKKENEVLDEALESVGTAIQESNEQRRAEERLFENTKHPGLEHTDLTLFAPAEKKRAEALFKHLQEVVRPLKEGEQALELETDPVRQRVLQAQLWERAKALKPDIDAVRSELESLGGIDHLRLTLRGLESESRLTQIPDELMGRLSECVKRVDECARQEKMRQGEADSARGDEKEEAIARLNLAKHASEIEVGELEKLRDEFDRKGFGDLFIAARGSVYLEVRPDDAKRLEEARDFISVIFERVGFLNEFHMRHLLYIPAVPLESRDRELDQWFDAYQVAANVIFAAEERLELDPENILLQRELVDIFKEEMRVINSLKKQFHWDEKVIAEIDKELGEVEARIDARFSWGRGFLAILTDIRTTIGALLAKLFSQEELKSIQLLHDSYEMELRTICQLQMQLERDPLDKSVRRALLKELDARAPKLQKLNAIEVRDAEVDEALGSDPRRGALANKRAFMKAVYQEHGLEELLKAQ